MKTRTCSKELVESICSMPTSSMGQNQSLKNDIESGLSLERCFIKVQDEKVVCRVVVFEVINYLGYFTVENIPQVEVDDFLQDVLAQLPRTVEWRLDLFTDKIHYEKIYKALKKKAVVCIHRESYTIETTPQNLCSFAFTSAKSMDRVEVLELMLKASTTTLDAMLQRECSQMGLSQFVEKMLVELLEHKDSDIFFQVLRIQGIPIGFVAVNELIEGIGGIGYIGVHPSVQGKHYSSVLLKKAIDMAHSHQIKKLIGDIDIHNDAMRYNLMNTGFQKDCEEKVFLL